MQINDIPWRQTITVQLQNGAFRHFAGAYDALDFLENEWPVRKGRHYENAITQCRAALCRAAPVEVAREAFIASCIEAALVCHAPVLRAPANVNGASARAA
ncbi:MULTISPECIES: DUF982 domain-containing protein [unclassified Rhizobium]|uniref:DUF982 domain-containing protein n=1 Tax=unclassified Rhizobium TaxID=2613769 RepID=UPI001600C2DB|nr:MULTISPECIES: DUF982 domain-containing protein [unclassified Rhizobium]MBB1248029.1 DUF982 domain-containing protein [Rhizobium sp. G21]MCV3765328.1 DUF982 domain-containing protein [Rhizobium sp. TRM95796]